MRILLFTTSENPEAIICKPKHRYESRLSNLTDIFQHLCFDKKNDLASPQIPLFCLQFHSANDN